MKYHMLYAKNRKSFEMRREKNFITLPCAKIKHRAKHGAKKSMCQKNTQQSMTLAVCYIFTMCAHDKEILYRVPNRKYTANYWAKCRIPVVLGSAE